MNIVINIAGTGELRGSEMIGQVDHRISGFWGG